MDHASKHRSTAPLEADARTIRVTLGMTQATFAATFGVPLTTLRDWEQGRSRPDGAARSYLLVIGRRPEAVQEALSSR